MEIVKTISFSFIGVLYQNFQQNFLTKNKDLSYCKKKKNSLNSIINDLIFNKLQGQKLIFSELQSKLQLMKKQRRHNFYYKFFFIGTETTFENI